MKWLQGFAVLFVACSSAPEETDSDSIASHSQSSSTESNANVRYFVAIHNEPLTFIDELEQSHEILTTVIDKANEYNIKLTLMFSPQWATYIVDSSTRIEELSSWQNTGHEIAMHHHGIFHGGSWDGYTDIPEEERIQIQLDQGLDPDELFYLGTLDDMMAILYEINPDMHSGCANDEVDKRELPPAIEYDTCSGLANTGTPGTEMDDSEATKGVNDYIAVGTYNGYAHKWLSHASVGVPDNLQKIRSNIESMNDGVYGAIGHSSVNDQKDLLDYLEFLHSIDPDGARSATVSDIIDNNMLPEETIPEESLQP